MRWAGWAHQNYFLRELEGLWKYNHIVLKDKSKVKSDFWQISINARWKQCCRWNCDLRVINATTTTKNLSYRKHRHDTQITWPYAYYVTLGSRCKMANSSSEDETDTLPERPTRIQPYQFEPVRQDFERVPEHRVSFEANPMRYSMGFVKSHSLKCLLHK